MNKKQIQEMLNQGLFPDTCKKTRLIETHISWIALTDRYAFKVKRPVNYSFLDFSTLEKRKHFCRKELELNRRLEPDMYLDVVPITVEMAQVDNEGDGQAVIEYALQMKRMDNDKKMDRLLQKGEVSKSLLGKLAEKIAAFHKEARIIKNVFNTTGFQEKFSDILSVRDDITELLGNGWGDNIQQSVDRSNDFLNGNRSYLNQRVITGFRRDCHGDLNASNIFLYNRDPVIFDCIEFNDEYRYIDVLNEIAFLCVDLDFYGNDNLGNHFYQHYLKAFGIKEDEDARRLFTYYKGYRANIRAKVTTISARKSGSGDPAVRDIKKYLDLMSVYCGSL
jgi:aminoglycoside phosphotransferase family enzyme